MTLFLLIFIAVGDVCLLIGLVVVVRKLSKPADLKLVYKTKDDGVLIPMRKGIINNPPRGKGSIHIPPSDIDIARAEKLAENKAKGIDTPLKDLYPS